LSGLVLVRRSLDARDKRNIHYKFVVDVVSERRLKVVAGRVEKVPQADKTNDLTKTPPAPHLSKTNDGVPLNSPRSPIVIVGSGPAGLFAALQILSSPHLSSTHYPLIFERGLAVNGRGKSIGKLVHRKILDPESNFSFGEGGAGTWSDGKLTTRIGRNSDHVRKVLRSLVAFGAPEDILTEGAPHLGTENLIKLLKNLRENLIERGACIKFSTRVEELVLDEKNRQVLGVQAVDTSTGGTFFEPTSRVILATGHSARSVYKSLHEAGVKMSRKGFAVGFRVEHPQRVINSIQLGEDGRKRVWVKSRRTNTLNGSEEGTEGERLPAASYSLATEKKGRGVYSFCMCPGGQIVNTATRQDEICVNGMSYSGRDSMFANSALVVAVGEDDEVLGSNLNDDDSLAGLRFQETIERKAAIMGGGNCSVPVQRVVDFLNCVKSEQENLPPSSYKMGCKSASLHEIYPPELTLALKNALEDFERKKPGYICESALLHGVETRSSSPLRIDRDRVTFESVNTPGLFVAGEGAGFAGGIVSAAVDGMKCGEALCRTKSRVKK